MVVADRKKPDHVADSASSELELVYAEGFKISKYHGFNLVEVPKPYPKAKNGDAYLLVPKDASVPEHSEGITVIRTPIERIVCTSTTHIPLLDYLDKTEALVGFPSTDYISSQKMRKRINEGRIQELGSDNLINMEKLIALEPEMVMAFSTYGKVDQFEQIESLGIPVVLNAEYLEKHPLGRAEWIKFISLFFHSEEMADSVFRGITNEYLKYESLARSLKTRPTVMSGVVYGDTWFLPGGKNYASTLLKNAGANYLWAENESSGWLELSFEAVYEKGATSDFWIGVASFNSLEEIRAADERYADFGPYKSGQVYSYDARKGEKGGSEFLELGYLRPDLILADLIKIMHPAALPHHELYFHKRLE